MENEEVTIRRWPGGPQNVVLKKGMIVYKYLSTRERGWFERWWSGNPSPFHRYFQQVTVQRFLKDQQVGITTGLATPEELFLYMERPANAIDELLHRMTEEHWNQRLNETKE